MIVALGNLLSAPVQIAQGQTVSALIATNGLSLCGIYIPSNFSGTTLTFQACTTPTGTYSPLYVNGSQYSVTVAAGQYVSLPPANFQGIDFLQIVAGTAQAAQTTLGCKLKGI